MRQQSAAKEHDDARPALAAFVRALEKQREQLEDRVSGLGGRALVTDAVWTVAGMATSMLVGIRPADSAKVMRDDNALLSQLGVAWLVLHTTATSLGDSETGAIAGRSYVDTARMLMRIYGILPKMIVQELKENSLLRPRNVEDETRAMLERAWDRDTI